MFIIILHGTIDSSSFIKNHKLIIYSKNTEIITLSPLSREKEGKWKNEIKSRKIKVNRLVDLTKMAKNESKMRIYWTKMKKFESTKKIKIQFKK